jgi:hypothetical protein
MAVYPQALIVKVLDVCEFLVLQRLREEDMTLLVLDTCGFWVL